MRHIFQFYLFFLALSLSACDSKEVPDQKGSSDKVVLQSHEEFRNDFGLDINKTKEDWIYTFDHAPMEDYDDPEQWEDYRVQLLYRDRSEENRRYYIFSMKLDGTDVRKAAGPSLLFSDKDMRLAGMLRSPNNRYLIARFSSGYGAFTAIIDLENQTNKIIANEDFNPIFTWSLDSRYVYFNDFKGTWKYDVREDKLTKFKKSIAGKLMLLHDGNFLSEVGTDYTIETPDGEELTRYRWGFDYGNQRNIQFSPNRRYLAIGRSKDMNIYDLEDDSIPPRPIFVGVQFNHGKSFDLLDSSVFRYEYRQGFIFQEFSEASPRIVPNTKHIPKIYMSIINHQLSINSRPNYPHLKK